MRYCIEKLKLYPFSCFIIAGIWIVCMLPVPETPLAEVRFIDKWTHFLMYAILTLSIWWEYARNKKKQGQQWSWLRLSVGGVLCPIMMGCLVEVAQAYLTTCRSGDIFDALCNSLGVLIGVLTAYLYSSGSSSLHKG